MEEEAPDCGGTGDDRDTGKELVEIEAANVLFGEFSVDNINKTREASDQVVHLDDPLQCLRAPVEGGLCLVQR